MLLSRFPRLNLAHCNTPLEYLPRLSKHLGGPQIYIKRDDCTGLGSGGNKSRKLEFLLGEAQQKGADTIITAGAIQSGHARQTAAAAAKLGLKCELVIEDSMVNPDSDYLNSGNMFLDRLFGARIRDCPSGSEIDAAMKDVADEVRSDGGRPYVIPIGGSNPVGALGYVNCAQELVGQANEQQITIDHVIHATGSGGTQAGLLAGFSGSNSPIPVLGVCVGSGKDAQIEKVNRVLEGTASHIGVEGLVGRNDIAVNDNYIGEGYGIPAESTREALLLLARQEGLLLDPVYTGKAMAGLIDLVSKGQFSKDDNIVFIHTGGSVGLFAYHKQLL